MVIGGVPSGRFIWSAGKSDGRLNGKSAPPGASRGSISSALWTACTRVASQLSRAIFLNGALHCEKDDPPPIAAPT